MKYFNSCTTIADIKKLYRQLCSKNHPDRGGDLEVMKAVNVEYKEVLQNFDGKVEQGSDGKAHTYTYNENIEEELMVKINELLALNLSDIEIDLIGTWLWISGNTKQCKEQLKALKCKWHSKRKVWFFSMQKKTRYNKKASLSDLAASYGCTTFSKQQAAIN